MTPQHPAAPETETDASGLRELLAAATPGPWQHFGDHLVWPSERGPAANDPIAGVTEEHQECAALIVAAVNALPSLLTDLDALRERVRVVEGERDAEAEQSSYWHTMQQRYEARAESAEAAYRAMFRQFEAMKADRDSLRAGVEALADEPVAPYPAELAYRFATQAETTASAEAEIASAMTHRDALADTGDAYTAFHGWALMCSWCDFTTRGKTKTEALQGMQRHYDALLPEGCEIR